MEVDIWNKKKQKWMREEKVKHIFLSTLSYFKIVYNNNAEKKFSTEDFSLDFIFSDNWKQKSY